MSMPSSDEVIGQKLTPEQRATLDKLTKNTPAILRRFDEVLSEYGIERRVYTFTTAPLLKFPVDSSSIDLVYEDAFKEAYSGGFWQCCVCPPPDEAPAGKCSKCPPSDGGAPDGGAPDGGAPPSA